MYTTHPNYQLPGEECGKEKAEHDGGDSVTQHEAEN